MIKVNSKVIIKELNVARQEWLAKERPPWELVAIHISISDRFYFKRLNNGKAKDKRPL